MARFKLSFDSYIKSDQPTKSLINFLIKNGSLYFTINEKDSNCQGKWEPCLCCENDGITVSSVGNNKYRITFDKEEWECGEIVFIRGMIANEQGKSYSVNDEIYRISPELDVYITADDSAYTDFSNLHVYLLPNIVSVTGNIRLNHYPVRSDYDLCIPIYDDKTASLQTCKMYSMATSEELNCLSAVANDSISHLKIEFQKYKSKENNGSDEIKMSLYDGENLLGFTSWQESTSVYVSNLSEMQLYTGETEKHYVHEYVHFFDFDDVIDFSSSLTEYESVIEMNFSDIEEHAHVLLPKDYSENNESPFYNYDSPIKKSSTSLKLFDRFKNVYVYTSSSDDSNSTVKQEPQTYDVLFAKVNDSLNIPVTFDVYTSVKNPNDLIPYSEFAKAALSSSNKVNPICKISLDSNHSNSDENRNISYQLRTTSFVIKYNDNTNVPVYYKIGICALDGTQKSTDTLVNEIKTSSMLTEEWTKSGEQIIPIIALSKYVHNSTNETIQPYYYCIGKSITTNKTSMIKTRNLDYDISPDLYTYISVPYNALVPISKVNESTSTKELKGLMFLQLCNTDGTEITTDFMNVLSLSTNINGTSTEGTIKCFDLIDHCIEGGTFIPSCDVCNVSLINDDE